MRVDVLLTGRSSRPKGGYKVVYEYANELARRGDAVTIHHCAGLLASVPGKVLPRWFALRALRATVVPRLRKAVGLAPVTWIDIHPSVVLRFGFKAPRRSSADVVVATAVDTAVAAREVADRSGVPGAYFIQHFEDWAAPKNFVERTWRVGLTNIVISDWLAGIGADLGVETTLVRNGFESFERGADVAKRPRRVLCLVSQTPYKRPDLVYEVFTRLAATDPSIECSAFGVSERPDALPAHVVYHRDPPRDLLRTLYQEARVFFCASDEEGFGLPPAEAVLSGASVVSTDIGGVRSYASGVFDFVPVGSADAITSAVLALLDDPARAQAMADRGRQVLSARTIAVAAAEFRDALVGVTRRAAVDRSAQR